MTRRSFLAAATLLACGCGRAPLRAAAAGRPADVLLMRHAEKHENTVDVHLDEQGRARAAAIVTMFPARFAKPDVLFAARPSKASNHSVETLEPLANALHLSVDDRFADRDYAALAAAILSRPEYAAKHILICWHHETLPQLARALGAASPPLKWPDRQYDHLWRLRYTPQGVSFEDLREQLLAGDRRPLGIARQV